MERIERLSTRRLVYQMRRDRRAAEASATVDGMRPYARRIAMAKKVLMERGVGPREAATK